MKLTSNWKTAPCWFFFTKSLVGIYTKDKRFSHQNWNSLFCSKLCFSNLTEFFSCLMLNIVKRCQKTPCLPSNPFQMKPVTLYGNIIKQKFLKSSPGVSEVIEQNLFSRKKIRNKFVLEIQIQCFQTSSSLLNFKN